MTTYTALDVPKETNPAAAFGFAPCKDGICAPLGVRAAGVPAGFRTPARRDLALIAADETCVAAATFTQNRFCAAPVQVSRKHIANGRARAVLLNSGNANAATGAEGIAVAEKCARVVAANLGCDADDVLVASTGVIGVPLAMDHFITGVPEAVMALERSWPAAHHAARAIMTTDTHSKQASFEGSLAEWGGAERVAVGGMVKGSGMIQPNMATMLAVVVTDMPLTADAAQTALRAAVDESFNKVTVDSDTSTNDSCFLLATGAAGGEPIGPDSAAYPAAAAAILATCQSLARQIAADGEGSTKLVTVDVLGAATPEDADTVARAIANSPLVKTAIYGHDANWGRVAAAAGKCGVAFDQENVDIDLLGVPVLRKGLPLAMDEDDMLARFEAPEVSIAISLGAGSCSCRVWTCDLTHEYITINGDYRT